MRTSILLVLLLFPFLCFSQFDSCEEAESNITCGIVKEVLGSIENFETNSLAFIATHTELYVQLYWECEDLTEIGEFLDVYSVLYVEECEGTFVESSPGCQFGPIGESEYEYTGLSIGTTYFLSFESCEGFFCEFEGLVYMENTDVGIVLEELDTPEFLGGCIDSELDNGVFCVDKQIRFATVSVSDIYPEHGWTVEGISGNADPDDISWSRNYPGNTGSGADIVLIDAQTEVYVTFSSPGIYEVCLDFVQSNCGDIIPSCLEVEIVEPERYFDAEICIEDLIEGYIPDNNEQGFEWFGEPIFLEDLTQLDGFIEQEYYSLDCECYYYEALEYVVLYPGEETCTAQNVASCPEWGLFVYLNGQPLIDPSLQYEVYEDATEISIRLDSDQYPAGSTIDWYSSPDPNFIPGDDGVLIASATVESDYRACEELPDVLAVLYNGFDQYVPEDAVTVEKELLILHSGSGFSMDELIIEVDSNCDFTCPDDCTEYTPGEDCGWNGDIAEYFKDCNNVIGVGSGDYIPANSVVVVVFGPEEPDSKWDPDLLCSQTSCIYVTRSDCKRCLDAFPNNGGIQQLNLETDCGKSIVEYRADGSSNGGYYTKEGWNSTLRYADQLPPVLMPDQEYTSSVPAVNLKFQCDPATPTSGEEVFYVKGVINGPPNSVSCCNPYSPTFSFILKGCDDTTNPSTLAWGPNSESFLPTDITITSDDCFYQFDPETFEDPSTGQRWDLDDIRVITDCSTSSIVDYSFDNIDPDGLYMEGIHTVTYTASDACGNTISHSFDLTIECATDPGTDPEVFTNNPWLLDLVDPSNCEGTTIETYASGIYSFFYIYDGNLGTLYFQDGTRYCQDAPGFNCVAAYGFGAAESSWSCEDTPGGGGGGPSPIDDYPWMSDYIDVDDCLGVEILFYDFYGSVFPYFEVNGKWTLFSDLGQVYCTDSPPGFYCPDVYGLGSPVSTWECGQGCVCTDEYDPVCGVDGTTYSNSCEAECAGVDILYAGECQTDPIPPLFNDYPWLSDIVDPNDCNDFTSVTLLQLGNYNYLFYQTATTGVLYNAQGQFYCEDFNNFSCLDAYGFTQDDVLDVWTCDSLRPAALESREQNKRLGIAKDLRIICYPNPSNGLINVAIQGAYEQGSIRVFNTQGQTLSESVLLDNKEQALNLQAYESGIYFIEVRTGEKRVIEKIILL